MVSACLCPSSLWRLVEVAFLVFLSRPSLSGLSPTLLSAASSPSHAPALFPSPSLSVAAPSHGGLSPVLFPGAALEDPVHVHAPVDKQVFSFYSFQ